MTESLQSTPRSINHTFNRRLGLILTAIGMALFLPIFVGGLIVTKTALMPFAPMLKKVFDTSGDTVQVVGKLARGRRPRTRFLSQ